MLQAMVQTPNARTFSKLAFEEYALAVGKASHAWNHLQDKLGSLFAAVSGSDRQVALAIWHSSSSERAQRKMLKAAIFARDPSVWPTGAALEDIHWLLKVADDVAAARRDAIHAYATLFVFHPNEDGPQLGPASWSGARRSPGSSGESLLRDIQWGGETAETLSRYTMEIEAGIVLAGGYAWPARPALPIRGECVDPDWRRMSMD